MVPADLSSRHAKGSVPLASAALSVLCLGSPVQAANLNPIGSRIELTCDSGDFQPGSHSVLVVFATVGYKSEKLYVRCPSDGLATIDNPMLSALKKKRHGRDGTSRIRFYARIGNHQWTFIGKYSYYRGQEISESDFDDYVNTCIDKSLHLYARGGKLYCYVQPVGFYFITRP